MTDTQLAEIVRLKAKGYSNCYVSACVDGVSYREIEEQFPTPPSKDRMSPKLREWWTQQDWVWRPDNQSPTEAPWERVSREWY